MDQKTAIGLVENVDDGVVKLCIVHPETGEKIDLGDIHEIRDGIRYVPLMFDTKKDFCLDMFWAPRLICKNGRLSIVSPSGDIPIGIWHTTGKYIK